MRDIRLSNKEVSRLEEKFKLEAEAIRILGLVVAEWESDPLSVQCFDLRTVEEARRVMKRLKQITFDWER